MKRVWKFEIRLLDRSVRCLKVSLDVVLGEVTDYKIRNRIAHE